MSKNLYLAQTSELFHILFRNKKIKCFFFRYGPRSSAPPPGYPPMGVKQMPPMGNIPVQSEQTGYRGRYDAPPFEEIPPGVEPPVPGFEPSPFEKPPFGPPGPIDRDRLPPPNYRDPYRPPPYSEGPNSYRDMSIPPPAQHEIPVHVGEQPPRYRENYRPGHYREQGPMPFRDGQPYREPGPPGPYRDPNFRGGPPSFRDNAYRNVPYRDGGFRDNPPHNSFRDPGAPFRPPSASRETVPPGYHDPNYRDNFRDETAAPRDHSRPGYRPNVRNRGGSRRNANVEHDRHREREGRDRDRYTENREPLEKAERTRDPDRRAGYDKNRETRENRDERPRDYERPRDFDKEREHDKTSPDKKVRTSPKRSRETREKKRSESKGRSRDRDFRREKKEDRARDKSSADRSRDHKDKEKKMKERKKKKREKEKDTEKKKKREKKDKKDKDHVKKDDEEPNKQVKNDEKETSKLAKETPVVVKIENTMTDVVAIKKETFPEVESSEKPTVDLYGDEALGAVDKEIIENYIKTEEKDLPPEAKITENVNNSKEEPFDGIELQANTDELDLKTEIEVSNPTNREMLATLPELSKWEVDEDHAEKAKEPGEITSPEEEEDGSKVTSDVIKRAENAIFAKAINSLRPIEIKKISSDRLKLYGDEVPKPSMNNIQITVPVIDTEPRSIEINERKRRYSKTPPPRLSVKDRLGGKVEETRRGREARVVQSTVERVKSRSKTPKREQPYRRVTVDKERGRKQDNVRAEPSKSDRRVMSEAVKTGEKHRARSPTEKKNTEKHMKDEKKSNTYEIATRDRGQDKHVPGDTKSTHTDRERKKSTLDEAHFEPDYDETVESDQENKEENVKKRERSVSPTGFNETKKAKLDNETIKLDLTNVKKKPDSDSETTSDSEYSSSSSSSDARKRKKKKKRSKKKKKRAASESDSESESSSDDHKKKKKKRKHKKKSSKKKKKSKHK